MEVTDLAFVLVCWHVPEGIFVAYNKSLPCLKPETPVDG
jgi:hypothetical protein